MEGGEDFVVVNGDTTESQKNSISQLRVLIDVVSKLVDSLNQSSILLKDELHTALSVTLQGVTPDYTTKIDELTKALDDSNVTSKEEVRRKYVHRLCARLVAVNEEKEHVMAEMVSLTEQLHEREKDIAMISNMGAELVALEETVGELESSLSVNPCEISVLNLEPVITENANASNLCARMKHLRGRLSRLALGLNKKETNPTQVMECSNHSNPDATPENKINATMSDSLASECLSDHHLSTHSEIESTRSQSSDQTNNILSSSLLESSVRSAIFSPEFLREFARRVQEETEPSPSSSQNRSTKSSLVETQDEIRTDLVSDVEVESKVCPKLAESVVAPTQLTSDSVPRTPTSPDPPKLAGVPVEADDSIEDIPVPRYPIDLHDTEFNLLTHSFLPELGGLARRQVNRIRNKLTGLNEVDWFFNSDVEPTDEGATASSSEDRKAPSFSAQDEEPWCPICKQLFSSRDELEVHLPCCLN